MLRPLFSASLSVASLSVASLIVTSLILWPALSHATEGATETIAKLNKVHATCDSGEGDDDPADAAKMTLLTCGLTTINDHLKDLKDRLGADLVVLLENDRKRLVVRASSINGLFATVDNCKNVIDQVRYDAGVDSRKGWLLNSSTSYSAALLGETPRSAQRTAEEKALDQAFHVSVTLQYHDTKVQCSGPLVGNTISTP